MSNAPQDPQADAEERTFASYMGTRFGVDVPLPPEASAPSSLSPASPSLPNLHGGVRISPSADVDRKLEAYLAHFFPGQRRTAA